MASVAETVAAHQAELDRKAALPVQTKSDPNPAIARIAAKLNKLDERGIKTAEIMIDGLVRLGGMK